jgi:amidophosphoribosyltransferase
LEFRDKIVLLVDDSIVRGTTCQQIIQMVRDVGAKKVYFASAAPAVKYPNVYGIDMPTTEELIASGRTEQEVCTEIGADWLIYQNLEDLIAASSEGNSEVTEFDCAVFNGEYCAGDVTPEYLEKVAAARNDSAKSGQKSVKQMELPIGLHNGAARG